MSSGHTSWRGGGNQRDPAYYVDTSGVRRRSHRAARRRRISSAHATAAGLAIAAAVCFGLSLAVLAGLGPDSGRVVLLCGAGSVILAIIAVVIHLRAERDEPAPAPSFRHQTSLDLHAPTMPVNPDSVVRLNGGRLDRDAYARGRLEIEAPR